MIDNINFNAKNLFDILESKYKLKEVVLGELYKYFPYYSENVSLSEVCESCLQDGDAVKIYVGDAMFGNEFFAEEERKYDLYILKCDGDKIVNCFYNS